MREAGTIDEGERSYLALLGLKESTHKRLKTGAGRLSRLAASAARRVFALPTR